MNYFVQCENCYNLSHNGGEFMPIKYKIDILQELNEKGFSTYKLRSKKILSPSTIKCLRDKQPISFDTLAKICELLHLQPSDIIEYVPNVDDLMKVKPDFTATLLDHMHEYFQDESHQKDFETWYQERYGKQGTTH